MNLHDTCTCLLVWKGKFDFSVKTTGSEQGWIKDIRPVGSSDNLDIIILRETIQLVEQLKHSSVDLSHFIFTSATFGTDSIKLIDEDNRGSFLTGKFEGITHHLGTITDEHLHELRACQLQERSLSLSSACPRHQCLTCAWWAMHQQTLGRADTKFLEPLFLRHWEHDSLNKLLDLLIKTTDIRVLLLRLLVDLHSLDSRIVVRRQLLIDYETLLVHSDQITRLHILRLDHTEYRQVDSMTASCLNHDALLRLLLLLSSLDCEARALVPLFWLLFNVDELAYVCDHVWQLSVQVQLFLVLSDTGIEKALLLRDTSHLLSVASHLVLHLSDLLL